MFGLIGMHLYLVIYKGISEWPVPGKPVDPKTYWAEYQEILHTDGEPFFPVAIAKDTFFIMICGIVVVVLAITVGAAQLGPVANPLAPANPRPDWYLIWYFALLALIPPASENYFIILFPLIGFLIVFLIPLANKGERHYARRPWAVAVVIIAAFATTILVFEGYRSPWSPVFVGKNLDQIPTLSQATIQSAQSPAAKRGAADMHTFGCLACHAIGNVGGLRGPNLSRVGDRLSEQQLITRIAAGGLNMPAFGNTLKPNQLLDIVKFLEEQRTPGQPVNVAGTGP
jgi:ubiquinol-cytochrome c reductase cytochrome b subunit